MKKLTEFEVGDRGGYIHDGLLKKEIEYSRAMIPETMAVAIMSQVIPAEQAKHWCNKDFLCVAVDDNSRHIFIYLHDFTWSIFIVWEEFVAKPA